MWAHTHKKVPCYKRIHRNGYLIETGGFLMERQRFSIGNIELLKLAGGGDVSVAAFKCEGEGTRYIAIGDIKLIRDLPPVITVIENPNPLPSKAKVV